MNYGGQRQLQQGGGMPDISPPSNIAGLQLLTEGVMDAGKAIGRAMEKRRLLDLEIGDKVNQLKQISAASKSPQSVLSGQPIFEIGPPGPGGIPQLVERSPGDQDIKMAKEAMARAQQAQNEAKIAAYMAQKPLRDAQASDVASGLRAVGLGMGAEDLPEGFVGPPNAMDRSEEIARALGEEGPKLLSKYLTGEQKQDTELRKAQVDTQLALTKLYTTEAGKNQRQTVSESGKGDRQGVSETGKDRRQAATEEGMKTRQQTAIDARLDLLDKEHNYRLAQIDFKIKQAAASGAGEKDILKIATDPDVAIAVQMENIKRHEEDPNAVPLSAQEFVIEKLKSIRASGIVGEPAKKRTAKEIADEMRKKQSGNK